jgi:hypothetical protein
MTSAIISIIIGGEVVMAPARLNFVVLCLSLGSSLALALPVRQRSVRMITANHFETKQRWLLN